MALTSCKDEKGTANGADGNVDGNVKSEHHSDATDQHNDEAVDNTATAADSVTHDRRTTGKDNPG